MRTFFSIVYLTINPSLKEKIGIGMIMSNGKDIKFKFSDTKLGIIKQLIPSQNYSFLKSYFKNLNNDLNDEVVQNNLIEFKKENAHSWVNEKYFSYLHRYSNNIVKFSEPKEIDIAFDEVTFQSLYENYIFNNDAEFVPNKVKQDIVKIVKTRLYSKIKTKVDLDVDVSPNDFKELISSVNVNFIGKNGQIVSGQTIDFSKRYVDLERDLTKYISFTKAVDYEKGSGHYFLVGKEPKKKMGQKNHSIWKHIYESNIVDYVPLNETDKIKDYIDSKDVQPYFEK
ncbi:hypothetical protein IWQ47_000139 [Aquimarina sp. EL_43]|uniref:hypothetical protein n=1 Tax=unclassified Aquimarina TaxID=2627091 RepID=UPI0018CB0625|nr:MULTISPECIES: hypothetical protein [unclassified Aquimarina]MBG6129169.1 hypothetical protein [Aquimarina sp. EL_35]MBG6150234.1 hypothetical protein [Aquimarina sp. EL_32]MBG6167081.1 hypothetical protein [Aquimarina sp. EL_43]